MPGIFRRACFVAAAFSLAIDVPLAHTHTASPASGIQRSPGTIGCRVLEAKIDPTPSVALVVFHQAESADRNSLGAFLRTHDGARIEVQMSDGIWHPASVFRLKSCFGRGLLVLPATATQWGEGDNFMLRSRASEER